MILGDPIFRSMLVLHDLEPPVYRVGLAPIDPTYSIGDDPLNPWGPGPRGPRSGQEGKGNVRGGVIKHKVVRQRYVRNASLSANSSLSRAGGGGRGGGHSVWKDGEEEDLSLKPAKVAIEGLLDTRYVINLGIGSPPQTVQVLLDTGSMLLAIFADPYVQNYVHESDQIARAFTELRTTKRRWCADLLFWTSSFWGGGGRAITGARANMHFHGDFIHAEYMTCIGTLFI